MKCPHCGYEDQISGNPPGFTQGEHGDFFKVGHATRENAKHPSLRDATTVYACPSPDCGKVFINAEYY